MPLTLPAWSQRLNSTLPLSSDGRLVVAALVERDLLELVAAVVAHDVQHERRLVAILVARVVLRLAVIDAEWL